MRRVVCDTGPILHRSEAKALHLLELTGRGVAPRTVDEEVAVAVTGFLLYRRVQARGEGTVADE